MPTGYRDDLPSAAALLERLDAAHARRAVYAKRRALEIERVAVTRPRQNVLSVVFFGGLIVAFLAFRHRLQHAGDHQHAPGVLMVVGLLVAAASGGWDAWHKHLRLAELTRIDADIEELSIPHAHVPPDTLPAAHVRIAEREQEEEEALAAGELEAPHASCSPARATFPRGVRPKFLRPKTRK